MKEYTQLDFTGQAIYVGLDIHKKNWTVSIFTEHHEHKTYSQNPDPEILANYLHRNFPGATYYSTYEAGYCGFWIHRKLVAAGIENIVINPADVPTKDKERKRKNNRVDSRKLARGLRSGDLDPIHIPTREMLEDRFLIRTRRDARKQETRYKNKIKAILSFYGIEIPERFKDGRWSNNFIQWIETIAMKKETGTQSLMDLLSELKHCRQRVARLNHHIRQLARQEPFRHNVELLTSIPGIGILISMIILTELGDVVNRFKSLDKVASFIGLVPGEASSGEDDNITNTRITPRSHHYLRSMLIESAWVAVRKDPALVMCYNELTKRMTGQKAIIRIARKLLNRIRFVLKNNQEYVPSVLK
jgi:transposase